MLFLLSLALVTFCRSSPCDFFEPFVGQVSTCTPSSEDYLLETNPAATPSGGYDVSQSGCRYIYSNKCCGIYPRWNWILGGCEKDMKPSSPGFACTSDVQSTSAYSLYYIAAYQWNGTYWNIDNSSSVYGNGGLINDLPEFNKIKIDGTNSPNPNGGDWQAKWAPRTATTGTMGLGPPGFMFVLSAEKLQWMTFYALLQKTVNRGPEGQFIPKDYDNCWYAELDFLEAPFWGPSKSCYLASHPYASFFSSGAQFGGCFPMGTNIGENFASECFTEWCCEGTRCGAASKPFIDPNSYGKNVAGCTGLTTPNPPPGDTWCGLTSDPSKCSTFAALGGCHSSSFFENDPNTAYMFAFVVDQKGIYAYRWISNDENKAAAFWPGLTKYSPAQTLQSPRPAARPTTVSPPCPPDAPNCVIFHPTSPGERPCVTAAGDINFLDHMGVAAAAGKNWWDLFEDTTQWWGYGSEVTPVQYP